MSADSTRILGIEGTAWAASAAVFEFDPHAPGAVDLDADPPFVTTDAYQPESGGLHPREAAEHMGEAVPAVIEAALDAADGPVDAVAFSRGPGLGPCLRIVGTAARALAGTLDVPLVGVNHMVAHLEIGRYGSGFESPVCLNASGANAHLLGYRDGRYRVLGETMDTGVGNALDKFTRHVGWSHPGGPKVERAAADGEYVDLPYVVKGMDFSFSGLMSAAKAAYDEGTPVEDVCFSLQETVFAMLTEVAERALSLTGADELVLGGGVGQNARLREMLATMCDARGASFYAPDPRYLRDNAAMIAVLGAQMLVAGERLPIDESAVDPDFRPDEVSVTWRDDAAPAVVSAGSGERQGAEAVVTVTEDRVIKRRVRKAYRHPDLDARLRRERTVAEARLTSEARRHGVPTPVVRDVDVADATLTVSHVGDAELAAALSPESARIVGEHLATLHGAGIVHGDPTVRNVRVGERVFLIDFGLGYHSGHVEDHAMDCHVFGGSVRGTTTEADAETVLTAFEEGYAAVGDDAVLARLRDVEGRGRYQ
jgi:N6-L-threonylcarbamoyladenine synthase/protein kinase Bud32